MLSNPEIPKDVRDSAEAFGVKLTRALKRLTEKEKLLQRHEYGHRNVKYSLTKKGENKLFSKNRIRMETNFHNWGAGCYVPGCSFEEFVKRLKKQWMELFEVEFPEAELRFDYEDSKRKASMSKPESNDKTESH